MHNCNNLSNFDLMNVYHLCGAVVKYRGLSLFVIICHYLLLFVGLRKYNVKMSIAEDSLSTSRNEETLNNNIVSCVDIVKRQKYIL